MRLITLFTHLMLAASALAAEGFVAKTFEGSKGVLPYRILAPDQIESGNKYPLVIFLHGAGERGDSNRNQLHHGGSLFSKAANRKDYPAFVVFPQCPNGKRWVEVNWGEPKPHTQPKEPGDPMSLVIELIPDLTKSLPIDTDRIYLMGISMGGFGVWDLAARHPDWFAAAVPICGGADDSTAPSLAKLPIWAFHGDKDHVISVNRTRSMIAALRQAGGKPKYTEYPGVAHNSWFKAFAEPELLPWLFSQKLQQ
jgi:predicted peptidase